MRILFDSKQSQFKSPFGTLSPGEECTLHIHIPCTVQAKIVSCRICADNGGAPLEVPMDWQRRQGEYDVFCGSFRLHSCGLYFYYFTIETEQGGFSLYKIGDDTNMEAGDRWQLSCVPGESKIPEWAEGAVFYQVFPDRFHKSGACDLTGKLEPYTVHAHWREDVDWRPAADGRVLNNDFFGGNFRGIIEKMDYIASLGTTVLYLNPICKAFSSHRYDTADYKTPDPMLGTEADFTALCDAAHAKGIRVILDGVFSHTGCDSIYFDKYWHFGGHGAYATQSSPYYGWYDFYNWPQGYRSWWDFDTLPTINKMHPDFIRYIITDEDSVVAHWLRAGADGFRLDVADELPDAFIARMRERIREIKPDAILVGEVWEDASNKEAYGHRRRYFTDGELDGVMNYPFRSAIIGFVRGWDGGRALRDTVMSIAENYPPAVLNTCMTLLGSHDTPRILTALVDDFEGSRQEQATRRLSPEQQAVARERLLAASFLQYTLPGSPSLYYGDEAGMEGYKDPFNRRPYPWGQENWEFIQHFKRLGKLRKDHPALRTGRIQFMESANKRISFTRESKEETLRIYCNRSTESWEVPAGKVLLGYHLQTVASDWLTVGPRGFCIVEEF